MVLVANLNRPTRLGVDKCMSIEAFRPFAGSSLDVQPIQFVPRLYWWTLQTVRMSLVTKATFQDFVDVQSRLVLLPCVEEEGCGAVVASYIPHTKEQAEVVAKEDPPRGEEASKDSDGAPVEDGTERVGDGLDCEESVISVNLDDEEEEEKKSEDEEDTTPAMVAEQSMSVDVKDDDHDHDTPLAEELVGKVLVAINGMEVPENAWIRMDLTDIIASIRDAPTPIVLSFQKRELTEDGQVVNGDEEQIVDLLFLTDVDNLFFVAVEN